MTTEVKKECDKKSFAELYTILGFQIAMTVLVVTLMLWVSSRMHSDMTQMHNDFKSEYINKGVC